MFTRSAGPDSRLTAILCLKELVPAPVLWRFQVPAYFSPFPREVQQGSHEERHSQTLPGQLSVWSLFFLSRLVMSDSLPPYRLYSPWNSPGQNTGVGSLSLLQGIFPTQGSNPGLPHCRRILYQLSHKVQREVLLSSRRRPSLTAKTNIVYFFPGLPGTDLESQQCHAFWRALHRKQMFKFSLGSCSFAVDNSLAHLSAWGTATQLMVGGDWVPTKQRRRTTACWAGHARRPPLVSSGSRQRL